MPIVRKNPGLAVRARTETRSSGSRPVRPDAVESVLEGHRYMVAEYRRYSTAP